jgi:HK97 family phage prohead protease
MDKRYWKLLAKWHGDDWDGRASGQAKGKKISGHAAVFNQLSENLGGFREQIAPGAFANTLRKNADVRLLVNHQGLPLARTKSGTLTLKEDSHGLRIEADVDESDPDIQRVLPKLQRGDLSQMSIGFYVVADSWEITERERIRTLLEVDLFDVSLVTYPAYPQTSVKIAGGGVVGNTAGSQLRAQAAARQRHLYLMRLKIEGVV